MSNPALLRTSSATASVCQIQSHPTPATQITQITSSQGGKLCGRRPVRLSGWEASRATADTPTTCSVLASRCSAERLSCFDFFFLVKFWKWGDSRIGIFSHVLKFLRSNPTLLLHRNGVWHERGSSMKRKGRSYEDSVVLPQKLLFGVEHLWRTTLDALVRVSQRYHDNKGSLSYTVVN